MKSIFNKNIGLLSHSHKRVGLTVILLLVISSFLDFLSITSFLPIIIYLINPDQTITNKYLAVLYDASHLQNPSYFIIGIIFIAVLFVLIKTRINNWITHQKASYAYNIANDLASLALTKYLQSTYQNFSNTDYTKEMNRISNLPLTFANNIIIPFGTIFSELIVISLMMTAIAFYNIQVLILLAFVLLPVGLVSRTNRNKLREISIALKKKYPLLLKYTLQSIEGFVEIKTFHKETFFKSRFNNAYQDLTKTMAIDHTISTRAARSTEVIAALCMAILISYAMVSALPFQKTLLLISLYAGVSLRVIPSVNRILSSLLQVRSHEYVGQELAKVLARHEHDFGEKHDVVSFQRSIQLKDITAGYETGTTIIRSITLTIHKGERILISGKSGSGKTTLLFVLLGFLKETSGEIYIDDIKTNDNTSSWKGLVGYVPQNPYILDASIAENIAFGVAAEQINYEKVEKLLRDIDLYFWADALPEKLHTIIGEKGVKISGGQRQRIAIARVLYQNSEILLLDEITNQLDDLTEIEIMKIISQLALQKKTIIMVSHRPHKNENFDSAYQVNNGSLEQKAL